VTDLESSVKNSRHLGQLLDKRQGALRPGDTFTEDHDLIPTDEIQPRGSRRRLAEGDVPVARARTEYRLSTNFYFTNNERPFKRNSDGGPNYNRLFAEAYSGQMLIATVDQCWYLDSYFCSGFHLLKRKIGTASSAEVLVAALCWACATLCFVVLVVTKVAIIKACCCGIVSEDKRRADQDDDGVLDDHERYEAGCEEASELNPLIFAFLVLGIVGPLTTYYEVILPCWECNDFEAAILHETGHFFGIGHPNAVPDNLYSAEMLAQFGNAAAANAHPNNTYNSLLASGGWVNRTNCHHLWDYAMPGIPRDAIDVDYPGVDGFVGDYPVRNSVMEAFTQHNPKACLTADDLEGIATLYPDCAGITSGAASECLHTYHNIGTVRILIYAMVPTFVALIVVFIFVGFVHRYVTAELDEERERADDALAEFSKYKKRSKATGAKRNMALAVSKISTPRGTTTNPVAPKSALVSNTASDGDVQLVAR